MSRSAAGRLWLLAGCAVAVVHAGLSFYWALGGRWLLNTVGDWAVRLVDRTPLWAGVVLTVIGVLKLAGGVVPILVEDGTVGGRRWWRILEACGAAVLVLYGAVNVVVGWAVPAGLITTPGGGYDRAAELGHAALWDPLFFAWGVCLASGLALTRTKTVPTERRPMSR